jgi:HAD superfamily hydrolase (TIGR01484 family)
VLTDIDDTLTRAGQIEPVALHALQTLQARGVPVLAITGRPVGWSEPFARDWPVVGIVAENGSVCLTLQAGKLHKLYTQPAPTRQANHAHLQRVLHAIEQQVPGALRARDSAGRETDIAIDHSEHTHLPPQAIAQVVQLMQAHGLMATVSSIHINGWVGTHDKFSGACWALNALLGVDLTQAMDRWVFVGDSPNDQAMFQHLPLTVGVANIRRFEGQLTYPPRWVTRGERGAGFAEVANWVLAVKPTARS